MLIKKFIDLRCNGKMSSIHFIRSVTPDGKQEIKKFKKKRALAEMDLTQPPGNTLHQQSVSKLVFQTNSPCVAVDQQHKEKTYSIMDEFSEKMSSTGDLFDIFAQQIVHALEKDFEDLIQRGVQDVQDFQEHVQMLSLNNEYFDIDDDIALNMPGLVKMSKKGGHSTQPGLFIPALTPNNEIIEPK